MSREFTLAATHPESKQDVAHIHQDANWNVIGVTDLGHHLVERSSYTPYGELIVDQETGYGDRDGDGDVDSTDKGTVGTTCTGTVSGSCRILDLDFDGDYDSTDATKFDALTQGAMRSPGRRLSAVEQPFAHQGLLFEPEIASYQNRARQYDPGKRRFVRRDPLCHRPRAGSGYHDGLHLYHYLQSSPITFLDPTGQIICSCWSSVEEYVAVTCALSCLGEAPWTQIGPAAQQCANHGQAFANTYCANHPCGQYANEALRHCVASGCLAVATNCTCAACIGDNREDYQDECQGQQPRSGQRGRNNNFYGRVEAGCWPDPAYGALQPGPDYPRTLVAIEGGCIGRLIGGSLDTGP